jgi:hypothetical protein
MAQMGFPALGFDRWCITSQLPFPNLFGVLLFKSQLLQVQGANKRQTDDDAIRAA